MRGMTYAEYAQQSGADPNVLAFLVAGGFNWRDPAMACEVDGTSDWRPVSNYLMCCEADLFFRPDATQCKGHFSTGWAEFGQGLYPEALCAWQNVGTSFGQTQWYALADPIDADAVDEGRPHFGLVCYNSKMIDATAQDAIAAQNAQTMFNVYHHGLGRRALSTTTTTQLSAALDERLQPRPPPDLPSPPPPSPTPSFPSPLPPAFSRPPPNPPGYYVDCGCHCFTEDQSSNEGPGFQAWSDIEVRARATQVVSSAVLYAAHATLHRGYAIEAGQGHVYLQGKDFLISRWV